MAATKDPWFVVDRSRALAKVALTFRDDVLLRAETPTDLGTDLYLEAKTGSIPSNRLFVARVKGTMSSRKADWMRGVKELYRPEGTPIFYPTFVFVVDIRTNDNRPYYAWVAEPSVSGPDPRLDFRRLQPDQFTVLDPPAVDMIVNRVNEWYDALTRKFHPA